MDGSIICTDEHGEEAVFYMLEQTTLGGIGYLLVTDSKDEENDGSFLILRENKSDSDEEMAAFDVVEDEKELEAVAKIFSELLPDVDLEV